jgi:hypothetical protein
MKNRGRMLWLLLSFVGIFVASYYIFTIVDSFNQYFDEESQLVVLRWTYILWFTVGAISVFFLIVLARIVVKALHGRYKSTRVFISYFHEYSDIALKIHSALKSENIYVALIPFSNYEYDKLIEEVRKKIIECNCVIVIPGENRSFVDAEILAASVIIKPIVFIDAGHNKIPDTAFSGYPVFRWKKINKLECKALVYLIRLITPNCSDEVVRATRIIKKSIFLYIVLSFTVIIISSIIEMIALPLGFNVIKIEDYSQEIFWIVYCVMVIRMLAHSLFQIYIASKIVRQLSITGTRTQEELISMIRSICDSKLRVRALLIYSLENELMQRQVKH